jgi:hypothetical protein
MLPMGYCIEERGEMRNGEGEKRPNGFHVDTHSRSFLSLSLCLSRYARLSLSISVEPLHK